MLCPGQGLLQWEVVPCCWRWSWLSGEGFSLAGASPCATFLFYSPSALFLGPLLELAGSPIYAVRAMAAKALVPVVPPPRRPSLLLQLAQQLPTTPSQVRSHNVVHGCLLQLQALLAPASGSDR